MTIRTQAWVLRRKGSGSVGTSEEPPELSCEEIVLPPLTGQMVLVEPLIGSWEGNMSHAIERKPVDLCVERNEDRVVLGNAGVVRVIDTSASVTNVRTGDVCMVFCNGEWDRYGYPCRIYAYDAPGSVGLLAKRTVLHERQLIRLAPNSNHSLSAWAGFSLRYVTAWSNWKMAFGTWRIQMSDAELPTVWAWGGGVSFAELTLAKSYGCQVFMITSSDSRARALEQAGIQVFDRKRLNDLCYDEEQFRTDKEWRERYLSAESELVKAVHANTKGEGASIFIDNIGQPVFRATVKATARQGVVTTCGWKRGMRLSLIRAIETIQRRTFVHTHYAKYEEACEAVRHAEMTDWVPDTSDAAIYSWDDIPRLHDDYVANRIDSYFPLYQVN